MRVWALSAVCLALASCASETVTRGADLTAMAPNGAVDLKSADGVLFLQSAHTGFLEAPSVERQPPARQRTAAAYRARETIDGRSPVPAATGREIPHITVRPRRKRPEPVARQPRQVRQARRERVAVDDGSARSLNEAFSAAYDSNPAVNRARSDLRAADEGIAIARSGNRPTVTAGVSTGTRYTRDVNTPSRRGGSTNQSETQAPTTASINLAQPLFRGFRTRNATRQAEANVQAERERLRATRQDVLLDTALATLDIVRFRRGVALRRSDVNFLGEQVRAAEARVQFGEGTSTDINQAEARLEEARAALAEEQRGLKQSRTRFRQLTGVDPEGLKAPPSVASLLPPSLGEALHRGQGASPDIRRALHEVDEANFNVRTIQGESLPTVTVNGAVRTDIDSGASDRTESAEIRLNVEIPIYQGGRVSAQVRQAKETLGSARINVDLTRDQVRATIADAWADYEAGIVAARAAEASIRAAQRALDGTIEELRVGQRTTLDVLNAQRDVLTAQITKVAAERQRDGAAFTILRGMGELDIGLFGLNVDVYDPREHHAAVRDKWSGFRTPDGR
ncbi:MAG: TolC family outer membrane protein [Pseudomonadota bacterium]